jgi:hypothetical protein
MLLSNLGTASKPLSINSGPTPRLSWRPLPHKRASGKLLRVHSKSTRDSYLSRLSEDNGRQGQNAHLVQQPTDGCDLSLRELRHRDQANSQRPLGDRNKPPIWSTRSSSGRDGQRPVGPVMSPLGCSDRIPGISLSDREFRHRQLSQAACRTRRKGIGWRWGSQ